MDTYYLNNDYISKHINELLCSYNETNCLDILSRSDFKPQTFVVEDKRSNKELLFFSNIQYKKWLHDMIIDQVNVTYFTDEEKCKILQDTTINIEILLDYNYRGQILSCDIYNQEFVDIIRKVLYYTIYGNTDGTIYTAKEFNQLADRMMPFIIDDLINMDLDLMTLFKLSVASGISGLDLKGAPAAASTYANTGIPMKPYLNMPADKAAKDYLMKLKKVIEKSQLQIFEWEKFLKDIQECKKLVWMTDDYIESHFDLLLISQLLNKYQKIDIEIIPKNGLYGNDLSSDQLEALLKGYYNDILLPYIDSGRLSINHFGPKMGAANIRKLSSQCIQAINESDLLLYKGCRIHEMFQGGLNVNSYAAFIVSRTMSEITSGLNSREFPIILCHLMPKEYAFWGIHPSNSKLFLLNDGRKISVCASTLSDHNRRINIDNPVEIIAEFDALNKLRSSYIDNPTPLYQEMDMLAEKLIVITKNTYDNMCSKYQEIRLDKLHEMDQKLWDNLEHYIKTYIDKETSNIRLLDIATGSGRDIMYAISRGFKVIGIDNSDGFIEILKKLNEEKRIPDGSFVKNDMRSLQFDNCSFDVVRHNASLLHLPIIAKGYMADKAISEAYRVLTVGGLLYVFVKKGNLLQFVDTGEGLGGRVFQFYTHKSINELLERNGFTIVYTSDEFEVRPSSEIEWISVIAQKNEIF